MDQMTLLWQFVALLGIHWFADFVLQTHWQASNKSKNTEALLRHIGTYTIALMIGAAIIFGQSAAMWAFVWINGALHFVTDFFTSRLTSRLYAKQDWHNFFAIVGFDQLIHQSTLAITLWWMFG